MRNIHHWAKQVGLNHVVHILMKSLIRLNLIKVFNIRKLFTKEIICNIIFKLKGKKSTSGSSAHFIITINHIQQ